MPKSFISLIRKTINISYICYQAIFLLYKIKTNKMATVPTLLFLQMHLLRIQNTCSRRNNNEMRVWQTCLRKSTCIRWLELDLKYESKPADELHTKTLIWQCIDWNYVYTFDFGTMKLYCYELYCKFTQINYGSL